MLTRAQTCVCQKGLSASEMKMGHGICPFNLKLDISFSSSLKLNTLLKKP